MTGVDAISSIEALFFLFVFLVMLVGYIKNLNKLIQADFLNGLVVARSVGLAAFPLGAIMGFFY